MVSSKIFYWITGGLLALHVISFIFYLTHGGYKADVSSPTHALQQTPPHSNHEEDEAEELAVTMGHLQRFADKLYFAGIYQNWELASFYVEEMEESAEMIEKAKIMEDGKNVSLLMGQMLLPQLKAMDQAVKQKSLPEFQAVYKAMIQNCNACHGATDHAFIQITIPQKPTYGNQEYKPKP